MRVRTRRRHRNQEQHHPEQPPLLPSIATSRPSSSTTAKLAIAPTASPPCPWKPTRTKTHAAHRRLYETLHAAMVRRSAHRPLLQRSFAHSENKSPRSPWAARRRPRRESPKTPHRQTTGPTGWKIPAARQNHPMPHASHPLRRRHRLHLRNRPNPFHRRPLDPIRQKSCPAPRATSTTPSSTSARQIPTGSTRPRGIPSPPPSSPTPKIAATPIGPPPTSCSSTRPAAPPTIGPQTMAKFIPAGTDLVFQMHYTSNGHAATDHNQHRPASSQKTPTQARPHLQLTNDHFVIPPGAPDYRVEVRGTLPNDALLLSLFPHMHLRGKSFEYNFAPTRDRTAPSRKPLLSRQLPLPLANELPTRQPLPLKAGTYSRPSRGSTTPKTIRTIPIPTSPSAGATKPKTK